MAPSPSAPESGAIPAAKVFPCLAFFICSKLSPPKTEPAINTCYQEGAAVPSQEYALSAFLSLFVCVSLFTEIGAYG